VVSQLPLPAPISSSDIGPNVQPRQQIQEQKLP
jgi:hypothetical protein